MIMNGVVMMNRFYFVLVGLLFILGMSHSITEAQAGNRNRVNLQPDTIKRWAQDFSNQLYTLSKKYSGFDFLTKHFNDNYLSNKDITVKVIKGQAMVQAMAEGMQLMLDNKVTAVEDIVEEAESAHRKHVYDNESTFTYFNAILINTNSEDGGYLDPNDDPERELRMQFDLEKDEHFNNIEVNTDISTVQVPTNVWNLGNDIRNGINATESLDKVFRANYARDPTLTWQYFGSKYGFFRNYPGTKWEANERGLDLYDCRKRGWYIQAATSPKDIIILIDASGSMTGLRLEIAKHTVRVIIDTLADDDFFNVLVFNKESKAIQPCFNGTLVQANSDNKELVTKQLENFAPQGIADFRYAIENAFQLLKDFNATNKGANCNQAMMVLTDGATEYPEDVFAQYNHDKKIRVFTYLIGREITNSQIVRDMACDNKGYYTQIATIADVEENAVKYIHVLSRPMVIMQDHNTVWTNVYMDTAGLQLMTTVAQPVFNKNPDELREGILLGVVGVDVPIAELLKLTPAYRLGVNGYPFGITNNGYILFHPDLRPKYGPNGACTKLTYDSVDLAEVELSDIDEREYTRDSLDLEQNKLYNTSDPYSGPNYDLRKKMVDRESGKMEMEVWKYISSMHSFVLDDAPKRRITKRKNYYYYTDLKKTPFSLGIVMTDGPDHTELQGPQVFKLDTNTNTMKGDPCSIVQGGQKACEDLLIDEIGTVTVAKWKYCRLSNAEVKNFTREENVINYLNMSIRDQSLSDKCDAELLNHLIFDATVTKPLIAEWDKMFTTKGQERNDILVVFVGTKGGLTRSYMNLAANQTEKSFNFTTDHPNTIEEDYYQRAAEVEKDAFVYSVPFLDESAMIMNPEEDLLVTASVAFRVEKGTDKKGKPLSAIAASLGYQMRESSLWDMLKTTSEKNPNVGGLTCDNNKIECVLVDNNGYIVASKDINEVGAHFAALEKNTIVFLYMLQNISVFEEKELVDYQAMCIKEEEKTGSASRIFNPLITMTSLLTWWIEQLILFFLHINLYHDWEDSIVSAQINNDDCQDESELTKAGIAGPHESCDQIQKFFLVNTTNLPFTGSAQDGCDGCSKAFSIHNIPNSNLILVVQDVSCECTWQSWENENKTTIDLEPRKIDYNETAWCEKLKRQRHRKRPDTCHYQHLDENSSECGRASLLSPSSWMIAIVCAIVTIANIQLTPLRS